MRVFISADIEGITGLVSWAQCSKPDSKFYDWPFSRRMMSHDVNAAVRGARAAGATEIVVKDSHGCSKNLVIDELEPGVRLISGGGHGFLEGMMQGISKDFDAAMLIGYHGKAGTQRGVMEHTLTGGIHRLKINGVETGEIGLSAATAGRFNVPIVAISSDQKGCDEATGFLKGIQTAVTKTALSRYSADLKHPSETGELIFEAARSGTASAKKISPFTIEGKCHLDVEYNRSEMAESCSRYPGLKLIDGFTVSGDFPDFVEAHRAIWVMMDLESGGLASQN